MSGTSASYEQLIRDEVWSSQLKDILTEELMATRWVKLLTDFPDGDTFTMPSIGQAEVDNYVEDTAVTFRALDTGEFQFTITEYLSSGHYITDKAKQDMFYANQLLAAFVPAQARAISERYEADILALAMSQTTSNPNVINGADHRWVGTGTNETMSALDFARALYALKKANVPQQNLVAIVDPSVEYAMNSITNLTNFSNNPRWEGIVATGIGSGMRFIKNIYGFDVYTSNFLADANETVNPSGPGATLTTAAGKANCFFSATPDILPFMAAWRQMPRVETVRNVNMQRDEFVTTARYGKKLWRPENLVVVLTDTDQV